MNNESDFLTSWHKKKKKKKKKLRQFDKPLKSIQLFNSKWDYFFHFDSQRLLRIVGIVPS